MTALPAALWNHRHVSERESVHYWEDGRFDNSAWEDCFWDVLIEFLRDTTRASIPATHDEAEALRAASGENTWSGSNTSDGNKGILRRYKLPPFARVTDIDLWPALKPGYAASVAGNMGVFPDGSHWRRHDPEFDDFHRLYIARVDSQARVWVCDPLAPASYQGEWMSRADLLRFVGGMPGYDHWVAKLLPKPELPPTDTTPTAKVRVEPGAFWQYDVRGNPTIGYAATVRAQKVTANGYSAPTGKRIDTTWGGKTRHWVHIIDGAYDDTWVDLLDTHVASIAA